MSLSGIASNPNNRELPDNPAPPTLEEKSMKVCGAIIILWFVAAFIGALLDPGEFEEGS